MELFFITPSDPLYASELELRFRILREPIGHTRADVRFAFEDESLHLVAVDRQRVFGCVLYYPDDQGGGRLFQMAVHGSLQGQGIGTRLVEHLEIELIQRGFERVSLHARDYATPFYEKLGYRCVGEPFDEVGLVHRIMEKELAT
jgi:ribosomal protein S18 acetylase RimI-like enzyme